MSAVNLVSGMSDEELRQAMAQHYLYSDVFPNLPAEAQQAAMDSVRALWQEKAEAKSGRQIWTDGVAIFSIVGRGQDLMAFQMGQDGGLCFLDRNRLRA